MTVNDPPVVFGPNISRGETFDTDMYSVYTNNGNKVDFIVWPALLLHSYGPVLCKGVAEVFSDTRGPKSAPPKSKMESNFSRITSENEKPLSTAATKKSTHTVPSRHDIEMFMEWREIFGKDRAREMIGGERYDNIRMYCLHSQLI
ncbi:uncharacterized protein LOC123558854 [Mercenaria mercenaria]|uniref:uncharacterized protein LOC123558854 n=1 Tax=Mercenaria mercenaria TaxID=6596 RepID=UPI001E1D3154|nr:uncharacterized protein LOC123558854 [Mercenaria mercenaria]